VRRLAQSQTHSALTRCRATSVDDDAVCKEALPMSLQQGGSAARQCASAWRQGEWLAGQVHDSFAHMFTFIDQSLTLQRTGRANFCERHQRVVTMSVGFRKEVYTNSKKDTHAQACYRYQACPKDAAARTGCALTRTPTPVCTRTIFQAKACVEKAEERNTSAMATHSTPL
jgi:hypothetical protein